MILLVSFSPSMVPAFATGGSAFFMKTNSIGQIYATFDNRGNLANAEIFTYANSSQFGPFVDPKIVSVVREENALTKSQTSLIYTITASDNSKGTYVLNLDRVLTTFFFL